MIGVLPGMPRDDHTATAVPGSTLLLYTDGLVERHGEDIDAGLARLLDTAQRTFRPGQTTELYVDRLLAELASGRLSDDVVVLAVHLDT